MAAVDVTTGRDIPADVQDFLDGAGVLVIDGEERAASGGATFDTVDPASEEVLASIPQATEDDVDAAVQAAKRAHLDGRWRTLPAAKKARILFKVGDAIQKQAESIAWVDMLDHGKPHKHAMGEMIAAANCFRYFAGWVDKVYGDTIPVRDGRFVYSTREPVGVCGQIIPWNFPFLMAAWKIAPALAFGNTVVLKPAEQTPLSALWLIRILKECGVPDGVANLVQGVGEVTGAALVAHPDVDKIAFTGSTEVGKMIMRSAADNLHKVTLELGGKSPNLIFPDAGDISRVAKKAAFACFYNAGEVCTAGTRLVVDRSIHDEVVEQVAKAADATKVGPGWADDTAMGPLVSDEQLQRVKGYIDIASGEGAELVAGGGQPEEYEKGFFLRPTVFDGVVTEMRIAQEEVFGPVLAIQSFDDEDEAIALANDVSFGLAAAVWTRDVGRAHRVAGAIKAGTVWVNTYGELDNPVSFGGFKQSGIGRELGPHAVEAYTQVKSVWVATS
ncbi:MAG: aldehyde dehydrogenase family protein [Actinobacteria bacterium]|nr:aldehyde dehydrogenase family protein [Actinomycetota bacterium]